jgi:mannose-6-phosphate isomerase-like protein (cupin superfamily)
MARAGDTIENPITGERMTFLATSEETGGEFVKIKDELPAGSVGVPMHYHLAYTETFEVLQGKLDVCVSGKKTHVVLKSGESVHVPIRTPHRFWNGGDEPGVFVCEIRPARQWEKSIRTAFGLARDGKTNRFGIPTNVWELALLYELSGSYITGIPLFLQRGVFGSLARIARWKGYDPEFPQYTSSKEE